MTVDSHARSRRPAWPIVLLAAAVAAICVLGLWRPWQAASAPAAGAPGAVAAVTPAALELPATPRVLVFGDSWTYGSAASDPTRGYAYVAAETLGWDAVVDGVRGSGYLKPGIDGGSFGERIAALDAALRPDLAILQGSINDRRLGAEGYREAVSAAWDDLRSTYPDAQIVVLGPAPQVLPVERETARIDADLRELAAARGWWYVSPLAEEWITPSRYLDVIDTSDVGRDHPSTAGHAYLASRLIEAIAGISVTTDAAADSTVSPLVP
ncbi:SGNH/GDSL hydrolase family protein [Microbacterium sp. zg.Y625]|uniref:SGNH/GDSL hydrolase family protein n=1 Tax=Microbacterium jiangjiandongii TaxID=3049071 RepID=UPI00214A9C4B|nr:MULTISPECIES: SGNH/GDSL hydrolase family protein [unclassified Microbacterium]MCR2793853.1 SGNH/GDSL hydrolase family protein [Microbacterium sp. zg.Y625]MCR2816067.1 SGNH/GDSL hydrolase family protein [Microbacterium sp. zg.Y843]WIM26192.1 SGNH/GDSL hydrolase family protein [Microbacterium sp. zg-Y625]